LKKRLKIILWTLISLPLVLACMLVGALVFVIQYPGRVLTPQSLSWVASKLKPHGIDVSWSDLKVSANTPKFFQPELAFHWKNLHYSQGPATRPSLVSDLGSADFEASLDFRRFPPRLSVLGPIQVQDAAISLDTSSASSEPAGSPKKSGDIQFPSFLANTEIKPISIQISSWKVQPGLQGTLNVESHVEGDHSFWTVSGDEKTYGHFQFHAKTPWKSVSGPIDLDGQVNLLASAKFPKPVEMKLSGSTDEKLTQIHLLVDAKVRDPVNHVQNVALNACRLDLFRQDADTKKVLLAIDCPLFVTLDPFGFKQLSKVELENKMALVLKAKLRTDNYEKLMSSPLNADATLSLASYQPMKNEKGFKTFGKLTASGVAFLQQPYKKWKVDSKVDLKLAIGEFQDIVRLLDKSAYSVPAPFHVLRGRIDLAIKGDVSPESATLPLVLSTRLASYQQSLNIDNTGTLKVSREHIDLVLNSELSQVQLVLPHIDLKGLPKVFPDSRIHEFAQKSTTAKGALFTYKVHVQTKAEPVKILTNLASAPVPIHLNLQLNSGEKPLGEINVGQFPVDVFHRKATIQKFDLTLEEKKMPISGSVRVDNPQYTVYVAMKGTVDQPVFQFSSEPALGKQDIISVLLFGKTSSDLDSDQSDSVGNTGAAVSERTLGLASLYLLSATPIQSVGYDPATGSVSTVVTLGSGTSLMVAGNQSSAPTVGIRKRLGRNFSITTEVTNTGMDTSGSLLTNTTAAQTGAEAVAALLEWRHRY
jgi:hypothetical protein